MTRLTPVSVAACNKASKFTYLLWDEKVFRIDISFTIAALFSLSTAKSLFRAYCFCLVSMSTTSYTNANPPSPILQIRLKTLQFKCWIILVITIIREMFLKNIHLRFTATLTPPTSTTEPTRGSSIVFMLDPWSTGFEAFVPPK